MKTSITKSFIILFLLTAFAAKAQPPCVASFTATPDSTGYGVILTNTSIGAFTHVQWSFGDGTGSTQLNPVHYYNMNGSVMICLTVYDSAGPCQSTFCDTITVGNPAGGNCQVSFNLQNAGLSASFYATISAFAQATYTWDFGDGNVATGQSPQHTYSAAGTYNVCVTAVTAAGCTSTYCSNVVIGGTSVCDASFTYNVNSTLFNIVQFTETATGDQSWFWDFGDGNTSQLPNPMHTYASPGTYVVCLTINNPGSPCTDTYCDTITVGSSSPCNAMFGYQNVQMVYTFSAANTPGQQHSWSFGDGTFSFDAVPVHTYGAPGTYTVCHTVTDSGSGCSDTWCTTITIGGGGNCNVSYTYTTDATGTTYTFTAVGGTVQGQYSWSFGDGTGGSGPSVTHSYNSSGNYIVCVSVLSPAGNILCSFCDTIGPGNPSPCIPVFYSYADSNALGNGNVNFGIYNPCGNMQFTWDFGDGTSGTGMNPAHLYADSGWYYVCVTAASSSASYTFCDSVYAFRLSTGMDELHSSLNLQIYPNPVSGQGQVSFKLDSPAEARIFINDLQGRTVKNIMHGIFNREQNTIPFTTEGLSKGIYLMQIELNGALYSTRLSVQ